MAMVKQETSQALAPSQAPTPMMMLQAAVERGTDMDQLTKLMDLQERWEKNEARKQYMEAVAAFKKDPPKVVKDMLNKQYGSKYTSLANLVNTVNETLSTFGLNARWDFHQTEKNVSVTCILAHVAGHSESVTLAGPPDTSGNKNPIQQIKSTITYLKGATFEAITGIASREANADDDGNGAGKTAAITTEQHDALLAKIEGTGADPNRFLEYFGVEELRALPSSKFAEANSLLAQKKAKRNA
jgi:hypothetical protein